MAYDAYRTAADSVVLFLGYRCPRPREATASRPNIAHAAMQPDTDAFAPAGAERFRQGRHESEYFDPARPVDKTAADARWAVELARRAIAVRPTQPGSGSISGESSTVCSRSGVLSRRTTQGRVHVSAGS